MNYDPTLHHRRSLRLKAFDYGQTGAYFLTIVTDKRKCLFGDIIDGEIKLSRFGEIARAEWFKTAALRSNVKLSTDEFMVMPNHIHGIVRIETDAEPCSASVGARRRRAPTEGFGKPVSGSIPTIVRAYKSAVTYAINQCRGTQGMHIWQRNYYEHAIRDQADYARI